MSVWTSHGSGRAAAGEQDVVLLPRAYRQDGSTLGVVYCHGAGGHALSASDPVQRKGEWSLVRGLAEHHPVVVADLGGPYTFGNPTTVARIDQARTYLQERWGAKAGPVALVGTSMVAVGALNYAARHRDRVRSVVGVVPVCDLQEMYTGHDGGYAPYIAAAWGITVGQALPLLANPLDNVLALLGLPVQLWYARDDAVAPLSTVQALLGLLGLGAEGHDVGRLGHTQAAIAAADVPSILTFVADHAP
jgi:pimeloyl-ACP methyl ester carboxylesterase